MMQIVATLSGGGFGKLRTMIAGLENAPAILAEALNAAGEGLRRATVAAETGQTGLAEDVIERAQQTISASPGRLAFAIVARGGNIRLKYFGAREGGGGVTAHPWGQSRFYPGAFLTSGREPNRAPTPRLGGQVFTATGVKNASRKGAGSWWRKIALTRSDLYIPTELIRGETKAAFETGAARALESVAQTLFTRLM
jgi:hypothetical protein